MTNKKKTKIKIILIIMSSLYRNEEFNLLKYFEQLLMFNNYSLNSCNTSLNCCFYFNIISYFFILLFSFILILLGYIWGQSKEDIFLLWKFIFLKNLLILYTINNFPIIYLNKLSIKLLNLYNEIYEQNLEELLNMKFNAIFWWEPWSYEILSFFPPFNKNFFNSPWHYYYKYRLSSWIRWHILEDRICIFVLFFLWILI